MSRQATNALHEALVVAALLPDLVAEAAVLRVRCDVRGAAQHLGELAHQADVFLEQHLRAAQREAQRALRGIEDLGAVDADQRVGAEDLFGGVLRGLVLEGRIAADRLGLLGGEAVGGRHFDGFRARGGRFRGGGGRCGRGGIGGGAAFASRRT